MLEHAEKDMSIFLEQLKQAHVISTCDCGCNSIEFKIGDHPAPVGTIRVLAEYEWHYNEMVLMVFIYQVKGRLAGIEIVPIDDKPISGFPTPDQLLKYPSSSN